MPDSLDECGSFADLGVAVSVRAVVSPAGTHAERVIAFESTDGHPHELRTPLESETSGFEDGTEFRFGDETEWAPRAGAALPAAPLAPYSVLLRGVGEPEDTPAIAITATTGPQRQLVGGEMLLQEYERTVPAGGAVRLGHTFDLVDPADVETAAAQARDAYDLGVALDSQPAPTTEVSSVTLTGTAFDRTGGVELRVGGEPATVAADGSWTATIPLAIGENAIEAVVTNAFGARRTASAKVTRTGPEQPEPRQPEPRHPEPRQPEPRTPEPRTPAPTPRRRCASAEPSRCA